MLLMLVILSLFHCVNFRLSCREFASGLDLTYFLALHGWWMLNEKVILFLEQTYRPVVMACSRIVLIAIWLRALIVDVNISCHTTHFTIARRLRTSSMLHLLRLQLLFSVEVGQVSR